MVSAHDGRHKAGAQGQRGVRRWMSRRRYATGARLMEAMISPAPPPPAPVLFTQTGSSALVFQAPYRRAFDPAELTDVLVGAPEIPDGIDYDRWVGLVRPAPRAAYADSLELTDYFDV